MDPLCCDHKGALGERIPSCTISISSYYSAMNWDDAAEKILITMLGHLGFKVSVLREIKPDSACLHIQSDESKCIIGRNGDRLEDLQYLVNRVLLKHYPDAPRVKVDCDRYREEQENKLVEKALELAVRVKKSGKSIRTRPLNAYYRRIVHNALSEEDVQTESPKMAARYKRIEILPN